MYHVLTLPILKEWAPTWGKYTHIHLYKCTDLIVNVWRTATRTTTIATTCSNRAANRCWPNGDNAFKESQSNNCRLHSCSSLVLQNIASYQPDMAENYSWLTIDYHLNITWDKHAWKLRNMGAWNTLADLLHSLSCNAEIIWVGGHFESVDFLPWSYWHYVAVRRPPVLVRSSYTICSPCLICYLIQIGMSWVSIFTDCASTFTYVIALASIINNSDHDTNPCHILLRTAAQSASYSSAAFK